MSNFLIVQPFLKEKLNQEIITQQRDCCYEYFIHTKFILTRTGVHSGLEKRRFHQAEEPRSPDLRKGDQTFAFVT